MKSHKLLWCAASAVALLMSASSASATLIDFTTYTLNGTASATANDLNLSSGVNRTASSGFFGTAYDSTSSFSGSFDFSLIDNGSIGAATSPEGDPLLDDDGNPSGYGLQGDGIALLFQNDPNGAAALGGGGGNIGAGGMSNYIGIGFQSWDNDHATIFRDTDSCAIPAGTFSNAYCGSGALGNYDLGHNLANNVHVNFIYTGGLLSYTAFNSNTLQSISDSRAFDLTTLGPSVYLGFSGATGLAYSVQDITNFDLTVREAVAGVPEPSAWAMMLMGFGGLGALVRRRRRATASIAA